MSNGVEMLPSFETEEDALKYARLVAALRPGDMIKVIDIENARSLRAVFVGHLDERVLFLSYDQQKKILASGSIYWHLVVVD